jgi:Lrp/AsnC family leucine-responsive transcriptional regulator
VAERVNLSPSPCLRRIKRLEEAGVIRQYVALLDPDKLGLGLLAYVNVRLEKHSEGAPNARVPATSPRFEFAQAVAAWPEVVDCYAMTGDMDFLLRVHVEDMDHFSRFMMADPAAPPGGAGREVELRPAADQGNDGAAV